MKSLWSNEVAKSMNDMEQLVYVSNLLGSDTSLVQGGGGNTSVKRLEQDFMEKEVNVLRVKASGHQLSTIKQQGFAGVKLNEVLPLFQREDMTDDEMVRYISHALMSPDSPRPSIETLLHGFIPFRWVLHSHSDAILSIANNAHSEQLVREALSEDALIVPYHRPGFLVAKQVGAAVQGNLEAPGLVLLHHGLVTWSDSCEEAYERHIELVDRAEQRIRKALEVKVAFPHKNGVPELTREERRAIAAQAAPALRGAVSSVLPMILTFEDSEEALRFVNADNLLELSQTGPATPEHVLSTKPSPLVVEVEDPRNVESLKEALRQGVKKYEENYLNYFDKYHRSNFTPHNPVPRLVIVPGIGLWGVGTDVLDSQAPVEIYKHTVQIMEGAEAIGKFKTMPEAEVFNAEYWPMELYKLSLRPKPKDLNGKVAVVTGAARGIGYAIAERLLQEGACVVLTDINPAGLAEAEKKLAVYSSRVRTAVVDVTNEESVNQGIAECVLAFGGVDILVSNAGIAIVGSLIDMPIGAWEKSFAVNSTGHFLSSRAVVRALLEQGNGGSLVFVNTKNALAPGKDFGAYSCAKASEAQLCRMLAIEHGKDKIRSNMINPDGVFTDLWSPEMVANRAKAYGVDADRYEDFLRDRTLLKESITVEDVAEAALFLASDKSRVTTGCIISVDGGAREAFPR
ncbi:putative oxidoreductase YuxG [Paenibacillus baekrokdamisoli]|uniref:Putative oxidoreductase YuxG n=1 Tax=Paenibacillus baekrokdamisoli TaxID=1712516 RepID=A0A3G9J163_9BACL|nr:bifunctional rhamnulose-1-phosphate aldolase/short-chain dehydrogenase [Paenibacillus baekrokdamisoli]MBB3071473.1 rhamnulose-1-phosphate aldolase/alcohol dehydrogenase [Paenibacillus baekrokdamisoli]BBH24496.1 putative oxidoreductase YuxG [Paenibacillus baekrokdamisoli]